MSAAQFSEAMVGIHGAEPPAVAEAYDFSAFGSIVDVGGATGNMLAAILSRIRSRRASCSIVLMWSPTRRRSCARGAWRAASRSSTDNFFESVPEGGDAYILSHIIHDWNPEQCLTILGNCRKSMKRGAKLADRRVRAARGQHAPLR